MKTGRQPKPLSTRLWKQVKKTDHCWIWCGYVNEDGYGRIRPDTTSPKVGVHRLSWILHFGEVPEGLLVCHTCDNPACVRPDHLFLGTVQDNVNDMKAKGRDNYTGRPPKCV